MPLEATRRDLEIIILSEGSQKEHFIDFCMYCAVGEHTLNQMEEEDVCGKHRFINAPWAVLPFSY